jgi:hypothetical protein
VNSNEPCDGARHADRWPMARINALGGSGEGASLKTLTALTVVLGFAAPAFADDGTTGFWITLWWPTATGALVVLFGAFCALWAQNTGRNAWLWFFLGVMLHVFAVAALLYKNNEDRRTDSAGRRRS